MTSWQVISRTRTIIQPSSPAAPRRLANDLQGQLADKSVRSIRTKYQVKIQQLCSVTRRGGWPAGHGAAELALKTPPSSSWKMVIIMIFAAFNKPQSTRDFGLNFLPQIWIKSDGWLNRKTFDSNCRGRSQRITNCFSSTRAFESLIINTLFNPQVSIKRHCDILAQVEI